MSFIYFSFPGNENYTKLLSEQNKGIEGQAEIRRFPDGESFVRVLSDVKDKKAIIVCSLHHPDDKIVTLYLFASTLRSLGAKSVFLLAPYLPYLRQDKIFNPGEALSSAQFASLLSGFIDGILTIDPHLHRISALNQIYTIPAQTLSAAPLISAWIKNNISQPFIIGPDSESEQWAATVAAGAGAPFTVLQKTRHGDRDVEISVPRIKEYKDHTPVLVDDIISTGKTMAGTIAHLKQLGQRAPVCIGIHALFGGDSYNELLSAGAERVVSCDTVPHISNQIRTVELFAACESMLKTKTDEQNQVKN